MGDAKGGERPRKLVVAALLSRVTDRGLEIFISQRRADQALPLMWEFPGGKVEAGESPEAALAREVMEELGVVVDVGRIWEVMFHAYESYDVYMLVYRCALRAGEVPRAVEVKDVAWVTPAELSRYQVLPADAPLVARLQREGIG